MAKRIALLLAAAVSMAALGIYVVAHSFGSGSIMLWGGGGIVLLVAVACLYFAAVAVDD